MSGLSPDALCRFIQFELTRNWSSFDAIKNSMLLMARSTLNLYECAVSISNADSTLWIFKEQPIDQRILTNNKMAFSKATLLLNLIISDIGGGDRTRTRYLLLAKQPLSQLSYTPKTLALEEWWVWLVSNQRPPPYQDGALTNWATDPNRSLFTSGNCLPRVKRDCYPTTDKCERSN